MNKIQQVVIAAGGKGSRLSAFNNPNRSKVLIEHKGITLFEYLIDSLAAGGLKTFIISTGYHTDKKIRDIVSKKKINAIVIPISECGSFRLIPYYLQDLLDERFMFVCGHQPLDSRFVQKMVHASANNRYVAACYRGNLYQLERAKNMKVVYKNREEKIKTELEECDTNKIPEKLFIDSPYILTKDVVYEFTDNNKQGEYSNYILRHFENGESLDVIESSTPPEFDYDEELYRTLQTLT